MSYSPWNRRDAKAAPASRRRAARPRFEALEPRIVQTVNSSLFAGTLFVEGDGGQDFITMDHAGSTTTVNGKGFADGSITNGIVIRTGGNSSGAADVVNITGMADATTIDGQGGAVVMNLGSSSGMDGLAKINIVGLGFGQSGSTLNLINAGDAQKRTVTIDGDPANGTITGLTSSASRNITLQSNNLTTVNLFGGGAGNTYNIEHTFRPEGGPFPTRAVFLNLNAGTGEDTVNLRGKDSQSVLTVHGQSGLDTVNIGRNGSTQGVEGQVIIDNNGSFTNINVDSSADATKRNVDIRPNTFLGSGFRIDGLTGSHGQLHDDTIVFKTNDTNNLFIQAGNGGNTFSVNGTFKAAAAAAGSNTIISTGTGADTVDIFSTTGRLNIVGQSGLDTVNVGSNSMSAILGDIDVSNTGSVTDLNLNNFVDSSGHGVTVEDVAASPGRGRVTGLSSGKVTFVANDVAHLTINASAAVDTFFVRSTQGRTQTTVNAGNGPDNVIVGGTDNTIDGIQAPVTVSGQGGPDSLQIIDNLATPAHTYTQTTNSLSRSGAAKITFSSIEDLFIAKGPTNGNAPLVKNLKFAKALKLGESGVLTGVLTDKDRKDKLTLSVDFGDGSAPVTKASDRKPFAVKHKFTEAGAHVVRVVWTDSVGNSNFKQMTVNVTEKAAKAARNAKGLITSRPARNPDRPRPRTSAAGAGRLVSAAADRPRPGRPLLASSWRSAGGFERSRRPTHALRNGRISPPRPECPENVEK